MTLSNWLPVNYDRSMGRFNRGDVTSIPDGFLSIAENVDYEFSSIFTRPGARTHINVNFLKFDGTAPGTTITLILRIRRIQFSTDTSPRYLVLYKSSDGNYHLGDTGSGRQIDDAGSGFGMPNISDSADFNVTMLFDRCYINFYDNDGTPLTDIAGNKTGSFLYYFDSGVIRTHHLFSGGASGYAVNDIVSLSASNGARGGTIKVTAVAAGVITTYTLETAGTRYISGVNYTLVPITGVGVLGSVRVDDVKPVLRLAAGSPPSGFTLGAAGGAAGKVEAGRHLFAVAYETETGFITAPGPVSWTLFNAAGSKKVDLSSIPVGPVGTLARHILASRVIFNYNPKNFNQLDWELFFVPNGRIADNTRTTFTVDFYDSELEHSADYLIDQLSLIPCSSPIGSMNGRLFVGGGKAQISTNGTVVAYTDETYLIRGSLASKPESFDSTSCALNVNPDDAGGQLFAVKEDRSLLYLFKKNRTYVASDTAINVGDWKAPDLVDGGIGTSQDGVSQLIDSKGTVLGGLLVNHTSGIRLLNGSYLEKALTWNIDNDFDAGLGLVTNSVILVDPTKQKIYCGYTAIPSPSVAANGMLVIDYQEGLSPDKVKCSFWTHASLTGLLYFHSINGVFYPAFAAGVNGGAAVSMYFKDTTVVKDASLAGGDDQSNIAAYVQTGPVTFNEDEGMSTLHALRVLAKGSGNLDIAVFDRSSVSLGAAPTSLVLGANFATLLRILNFNNEGFLVRISPSGSGSWFDVSKLILFGLPYGVARPL